LSYFNWQNIAVGLLFIGAMAYLYKTIRKSSQGHACEGGACKCAPDKPQQAK